MKKRILMTVLTVCMLFCLLPLSAAAENTDSPYGLYVGGIPVTSDNCTDVLGDADEGATVTYAPDTNTLTLNNATVTGKMVSENGDATAPGIYYSNHSAPMQTLIIELIGRNTVVGDEIPSGWAQAILISGASVQITGEGSLNLSPATPDEDDSGSDNNASRYGSAGIHMTSGSKLTISSGELTIEATDENSSVTGTYIGAIYAENGTVEITGGKVTAFGGNVASGGAAYGIKAQNLTISGGTVNVTSGDGGSSCAIEATTVTITGGKVTANAGTAIFGASMGLQAEEIIINGGADVTATADESCYNEDAQSSGNAVGIGANKITIEGATTKVTANGGAATNATSAGIAVTGTETAGGIVTITDATVIANGGDVDGTGNSYGIAVSSGMYYEDEDTNGEGDYRVFIDGSLTISGTADVTATGGTATYTGEPLTNPDTDGNLCASSFGIGVVGDVTVEGGELTANGGEAEGTSMGIGATNDVSIEAGTVNTTGGESDMSSFGIIASNHVTIGNENGTGTATVTAKGGTAGGAYSAGLAAYGLGTEGQGQVQTYPNANVTATGGTVSRGASNDIMAINDGNGSVALAGTVTLTDKTAPIYCDGGNDGIKLTVIFMNNGEVYDTQTVSYGGTATAPSDPTREGYVFTNWDKGFDNVTVPLTVTAQYQIKTCTVTFYLDNEDTEGWKTLTVEHGKAATIDDPTREGYRFDGWSVSDELLKEVTCDLDVYASWTEIQAQWGASKEELTFSGTIFDAMNAAKTDENVKYVLLYKDVDGGFEVVGGNFELDLNGKTVNGNITVSGGTITITDSVGGGKVCETTGGAVALAVCDPAVVTVEKGSFEGMYAVSIEKGAKVTLNGGSFTGDYAISNYGTLTLNGGSLFCGDGDTDVHVYHEGTAITLKDYSNPAGLTLLYHDETRTPVALPNGYCWVNVNGAYAETLEIGDTYTVNKVLEIRTENKEIVYDGNTYDVSQLFTVSPDDYAGNVTYSIVTEGTTGDGELNGTKNLTVTKAGTFTIELTAPADGTYAAATAKATLTVTRAAQIITTDTTPLTAHCSETLNAHTVTLTAGNGAITYESSDPAVAEIDATTGKITAHMPGDVIITVKAAETDLYSEAEITYTLTVSHEYGTDWTFDETNHWHACACGEKRDEAAHSGGTATCTEQKTCEICGQKYGDLATDNHSYGEWTVTTAPTKADPGLLTRTCAHNAAHTDTKDLPALNGTDYAYTEVTPASCFKDGEAKYTYTKDGATFDFTAPISATNAHDFTGEWQKDADGHWYICKTEGCTATDTKAAHTPGAAPTETTAQYCTVCGYEIAPALGHTHSYGTDWTSDETNHWHECACGEQSDVAAHSGGTATCQTQATCATCSTAYGEKNPANHAGTAEWTKDETHHSKAYTCCGTVVVAEEVHEWQNHICTECGYGCTHADADTDHKCDTCGSTVGTHEAATGKHTCDYCNQKVTDCADANKDHKCDTCGTTMGTHEAATGKHTCDYCDQKVTDCADANKDHKCDTCGATMGTHEAATGKHTCDYCDQKVTDCADANKDHKCDVCGETLTQCVDENGDKKCDVCGKDFGTACLHKDENNDHKCDACGETLTSCRDRNDNHKCDICGRRMTWCRDLNKDHACDICDKTMGTHEAVEGKHTCDYCGEIVTACADGDSNHNCDICGTAVGEHKAKTEWLSDGETHWHACETCDEKLDVAAHTPGEAATCTTDQTCTVCGYVLAEKTGHTYGTEWKTNETEHRHECHCGDKTDVTAHTFADIVKDETKKSDADCVNAAVYHKSCSVCGIIGTETFAHGTANGHSFTTYKSDNNATCTADGTETAKCDRCDATDTRTDTGSAKGHSFTDYKSDGNATCTADGTKTAKCDHCDATDTQTETGSMLPHTFEKGACTVCGAEDPDYQNLTWVWIVVAVVVLGGGGFAIYWFVIRKKKQQGSMM